MAIRLTNQTAAPQYGRITSPRGTFLSNPSTAPDGILGRRGALLPSQANPYATAQAGISPVTQFDVQPGVPYGQVPTNPALGYGTNPVGVNVNFQNLGNNILAGVRNALGVDIPTPTGPVFTPGTPNSNLGRVIQTNSPTTTPFAPQRYEGMQGVQLQPGVIPAAQANITGGADGLSPEQVRQQMIAAGFTLQNRPGIGEVWVPGAQTTARATGAGGGALDSRGRPEFVNGAALAPGESMTNANGVRYVGGTPAPDGTAQYAVNLPNQNAANDTHGKYKWISEVKRDSDGNWVRINRQVLRKVYTRSHLKNRGGGGGGPAPTAPGEVTPGEQNQLVTFRAQYG